MNNNKLILVTGATGQSGGATARHLLVNGWRVRALTRDPNKPKAQALKEVGVEVVQGDFADEASLQRALEGAYGVFSVQLPNDLVLEVEHGIRVADLAQAAEVNHLVYSSVGGAERNTGIPHFESKRKIELHIQKIGIPYTIIRPAYFMENLNWKKQEILLGQFVSLGLDVGKSFQMIASDDIGAFACLAFENPEMYAGQEIEIAGVELTENQIAKKISTSINRLVEVVPDIAPPKFKDSVIMNEWFNKKGFQADLDDLRKRYPELTNFETWLKANNWAT